MEECTRKNNQLVWEVLEKSGKRPQLVLSHDMKSTGTTLYHDLIWPYSIPRPSTGTTLNHDLALGLPCPIILYWHYPVPLPCAGTTPYHYLVLALALTINLYRHYPVPLLRTGTTRTITLYWH